MPPQKLLYNTDHACHSAHHPTCRNPIRWGWTRSWRTAFTIRILPYCHQTIRPSIRVRTIAMPGRQPYDSSGIFTNDQNEGNTNQFPSYQTAQVGSHTWPGNNDLQPFTPPESTHSNAWAIPTTTIPNSRDPPQASPQASATTTTTTTSLPSPAAPPSPEIPEPGPHASLEQRFEYTLSCAQRVGFDSFDAMATQYYARNFDAVSGLALEQRLSLNRRLPELLGELRRCSATWNSWQRRGYQAEILKAAEEICAAECRELRQRTGGGGGGDGEENPGLRTDLCLEEALPNLWALLTGLASDNPHLSTRDVGAVVFAAMKLLCGAEDPGNFTTRLDGS
ncbi:hypothetical protein B0I37DRAFT_406399 [Chaetomium sp. MPI-CAGE-AT-0009]|nr:hypothetical protein B0I37DRAFT_406399 [Chaetomium sp. MPI-CAGE-AT-0009]